MIDASLSTSPIVVRFDPNIDPQIGPWVLVVPSRWQHVMSSSLTASGQGDGAAASPLPLTTTPPSREQYVHTTTGAIAPHNAPPSEFGGTDYEPFVDEASGGQWRYRHRWDPSIVTADRGVMRGLEPPPQWVAELKETWQDTIADLEETAERFAVARERQQALADRGLTATGVGPWQPLL